MCNDPNHAGLDAEIERLRELVERNDRILGEVQAERDGYKEALQTIIRMAEEPHLQIARAAEVAQAALNQQGDTQSKGGIE